MAVLTVNNVKMSFADDVILQDITFEVQKGERIGLVGINGSGKTTLFKVLTGEYTMNQGSVIFSKDCKPGYMEQHVPDNMELTAFEEVLKVFSRFIDIEKRLDSISQELHGDIDDKERNSLIQLQSDLNDEYLVGGLTYKNRVKSTLIGLGFDETQIENKVGVLSGGQKAKNQLAKMLLSGADMLLLDEPTNHLDIDAVEWLEGFLTDYKGTYIVISHDRYFLDKMTGRTLELKNTKLYSYKGNYTKYLSLRGEKHLTMQRVYDAKVKEIKRIEGIIEQQKRFNQARNYVTIASKQKQIDRLAPDLERPEREDDKLDFVLKARRRSGDEVLMAKDRAFSFEGNILFSGVDLDIRRGERVFLLGPNGIGKTSLFKILIRQYRPDDGYIKFGAGVDVGYYEQSQSGLDDSKSVIDEIWDQHPLMNQTQIRNALAIFLFKGEDVFKSVGALSGGERARLLLLKLMMSKTNFLLLDEPTNHLDIDSCEALENTLSDYDGTLFVVSHDRYLINKLATKIYYLDNDGAEPFVGYYDEFINARKAKQAQLAEQDEKKADKENPYRQKKERDARLRKLRADLGKCERDIEENDLKIKNNEGLMSDPEIVSDYEEVLRLTDEAQQLSAKSEELLEMWTGLSAEIEELESM